MEDKCKLEIIEKLDNNLIILEEKKYSLDPHFGFVTKRAQACPKYYFADRFGNRLSKNYYSIEELDELHYLVTDFDFMYSLGLDEYISQYNNEISELDISKFKFHYGIVTVIDNKILEVVPTVYNRIEKSNNNVIIVYCDKRKGLFKNVLKTIDSKLGAINLDINSSQYGMNIIPTICDRIVDFDLEYIGYAKVKVGNVEGYLSKDINFDKYNEFLRIYSNYTSGLTDYKTYLYGLENAVSKILYTTDEIKKKTLKLN